MSDSEPCNEIEAVAVRLLAGREHSQQELRGKLIARGYPVTHIDSVLLRLTKAGLQSDTRFTESYASSRVRKGCGPLRIRAELRSRGIDDSLISRQLDVYAEEWEHELRRVHDTKYGSGAPTDRKEMAKRARFLESRGFPAELIRRLLFSLD